MEIIFNESIWRNYKRLDFQFNGYNGILVFSNNMAQDNYKNAKWIWRAEFFSAFDNVDMEMLNRGYSLAFYSIPNLYGCPKAIALMKTFYDFLIKNFDFNLKTILIGLSRGGLYSVNFALKYPKLVAGLYLDAPVLDINSWPRKSSDENNFKEWKTIYNLDDDGARNFKDSPIDKIDILIENKIPIYLIAGNADTEVDFNENSKKLIDKYKDSNVNFGYIIKEGANHHPHGVEDPTKTCDFLCSIKY